MDFNQQLITERLENWRTNPKYLSINGITRADLMNGTGFIEKLKYPPWDKRNDKQALDSKVGFGKYHDKEVKWVKDNDLHYFEWMISNVPKFAAKVRLLEI